MLKGVIRSGRESDVIGFEAAGAEDVVGHVRRAMTCMLVMSERMVSSGRVSRYGGWMGYYRQDCWSDCGEVGFLVNRCGWSERPDGLGA